MDENLHRYKHVAVNCQRQTLAKDMFDFFPVRKNKVPDWCLKQMKHVIIQNIHILLNGNVV